ncbi:MAG: hypothetical protein RBT68_03970 [Spirochaetia bacterium]|jgi:hypothetical protein|nr:hypothetical protein [Spirochaetia bacterium]
MRSIRRKPVFVINLLTMAIVFLSFSCSTKAEMTIGKDSKASISLVVSIPPEIEAWMRRTTGLPAGSPLFNSEGTAEALRNRGFKVISSRLPNRYSQEVSFETADLAAFIASDTRLKDSSLIHYKSGQGWASIRLTVTSTNASALIDLFPGLDPQLLEALQPPALFYNPVTTAEYRSMLGALMGRTAAGALDATKLNLKLILPGTILESSGMIPGSGPNPRTAEFTIAVVDAMVLEKPIDIYLKWEQ